ncbi:sugar ABC transporter ATP-binding protein [Oscillibacter hominis]|uniref:Sugar ABC transporter ATP-binding protein n=1 Tax=Oscillibacter hominis TaxID=2763056 RepID=A0A7G9B540_9FIRM|nr:ATP-binding cassette domain-containing protein [Oscillibacter hominis]QNL44671.1 sugar ABC transporter ATP-binding protein [Oscillibacter hominis]
MTLLTLKGIRKHFGPIQALDGVDAEIVSGWITAIVGDNGSGKSTLIKILSGNLEPDSGTICTPAGGYPRLSIRQSIELGIRTVYQDLSLDNYKNSYENVFLGCEPMRCGVLIDRRTMRRETRRLLDQLEIHIPDLELPVRNLSGGQRQGLAIARALRTPGKVLLLDEPTAAMGIRESHNTLELLRRLRSQGMTQVLVSHNLYQVFDVADRVVVMRAGRCIADVMTASSSPEAIHTMILQQESEER